MSAFRKSSDYGANTWWPSVEQTPTEFHKDFRDLCALLNAAKVDFLIVGGYAVAFHGAPRFTGDLDILVRPDRDQVSRMLRALADFGFPSAETSPDYLLSEKKMLQLGRIPVQVHVMTTITGVNWPQAWESRQGGSYGGVPVFFLGRSALIANKTATGRPKDLADVEALRRKEEKSP
jgi:hypothetical protein